ncbi:MAG: hypothetical protein CVU05_08905 [Bacteroidetes bacterium HGW-Bacteroidetes-21]|jgi:uncharacterized protein YceK|nr:MAG: hypothetical protein CVU05_08905 [Bacteroidetes bacterium HGW-Bacteroidetes-21]
MKKIILYLFVILSFSSCEKIIDMDIPDEGRKVVINSIFCDSAQLVVSLHQSRHILDDDQFNVITGAVVKVIYENGTAEILTENGTTGYYQSASTARLRGSYQIEVTSGGEITSAATKIPVAISVVSVDTNSYESEGDPMFSMDVQFDDPEGEKNYYMLGITRPPWYGSGMSDNYRIFINSMDPSVQIDYGGYLIFSDELFNGRSKKLTVEMSKYEFGNDTDSLDVTIELRSLSYDAYMFYLTSSAQLNQGAYSFNEPVQVYNNIENGYGIFGGYSFFVRLLRVPSYNKVPR